MVCLWASGLNDYMEITAKEEASSAPSSPWNPCVYMSTTVPVTPVCFGLERTTDMIATKAGDCFCHIARLLLRRAGLVGSCANRPEDLPSGCQTPLFLTLLEDLSALQRQGYRVQAENTVQLNRLLDRRENESRDTGWVPTQGLRTKILSCRDASQA